MAEIQDCVSLSLRLMGFKFTFSIGWGLSIKI